MSVTESHPSTVKEALVKARDLISEPDRWTKGVLRDVNITDDGTKVRCYCAMGALRAATLEDFDMFLDKEKADLYITLLETLGKALPEEFRDSIASFNDDTFTDHADVLAAFDRAIEEAP